MDCPSQQFARIPTSKSINQETRIITMTSFYLTLPSNTIDTHKNTQSEFRVRLPHKICLDGDWEVALVELIYPHSWYNLTKGEDKDTIFEIVVETPAKTNAIVKLQLPNGYYQTANAIIEALNKLIDEQKSALSLKETLIFSFDPVVNRVSLKAMNLKGFGMGRKLQYMLGFEQTSYKNNQNTVKITAKYPVDLRAGFESMYVYCDLVQNQIVGNTLAPLLRVVTVEGRTDEIVCKTFNNPHYVPVSKRELNSIEIGIKDDSNKPIGFLYGKVIVKLHLRKQKFVL